MWSNTDKTKLTVFSKRSMEINKSEALSSVGNTTIGDVSNFVYLVSKLTWNYYKMRL